MAIKITETITRKITGEPRTSEQVNDQIETPKEAVEAAARVYYGKTVTANESASGAEAWAAFDHYRDRITIRAERV